MIVLLPSSHYFKKTDVFLVCYSVDNRTSFDNIENKWIPELRSHCPKVPLVLVGMF